MFFINFLILLTSFIISIFLFFQLPSQYHYTFLFSSSVLDFIVNNSKLLLLTNLYDHDLLQNINAENNIEDRNYNSSSSSNQIISINKNIIDNSDDFVILGAWIPKNNSISLEHLKGEEEQKMQYTLFLTKAFMNTTLP